MAKNILQVSLNVTQIRDTISRVLQNDFTEQLKHVVNPYAKNKASKKITSVLKNYSSENLINKDFVDLI